MYIETGSCVNIVHGLIVDRCLASEQIIIINKVWHCRFNFVFYVAKLNQEVKQTGLNIWRKLVPWYYYCVAYISVWHLFRVKVIFVVSNPVVKQMLKKKILYKTFLTLFKYKYMYIDINRNSITQNAQQSPSFNDPPWISMHFIFGFETMEHSFF